MLIANREFHSELLGGLGIPHLEIRDDQGNIVSFLVTSPQATEMLEAYVANQKLTGDEAGAIQTIVDEVGLLGSSEEVIERITSHDLGEDRMGEWSFTQCHRCSLPVAHGHIKIGDMYATPDPFITFSDVLSTVVYAVVSGEHFDIPTGIHILQQALSVEMAFDKKTLEARINALTPMERAAMGR